MHIHAFPLVAVRCHAHKPQYWTHKPQTWQSFIQKQVFFKILTTYLTCCIVCWELNLDVTNVYFKCPVSLFVWPVHGCFIVLSKHCEDDSVMYQWCLWIVSRWEHAPALSQLVTSILPFTAEVKASVCKRIWGSHSRLHWDCDDFHLCWCWLLLLPISLQMRTTNTQYQINEHTQTHYLPAFCEKLTQSGVCFRGTKESPFI